MKRFWSWIQSPTKTEEAPWMSDEGQITMTHLLNDLFKKVQQGKYQQSFHIQDPEHESTWPRTLWTHQPISCLDFTVSWSVSSLVVSTSSFLSSGGPSPPWPADGPARLPRPDLPFLRTQTVTSRFLPSVLTRTQTPFIGRMEEPTRTPYHGGFSFWYLKQGQQFCGSGFAAGRTETENHQM